MPLLDIRTEKDGVLLGIWQITESAQELACLLPTQEVQELSQKIPHLQKLVETLAGRVLVQDLLHRVGKEYVGIAKTLEKAPYFPNHTYQVSISHTANFATAVIHPSKILGIDIEQARSQMTRIAHRIMSAEELAFIGQDLAHLALLWCAKETLYKIHRAKGLDFRYDMLILPFELEECGVFRGALFPHEPHPPVFDIHYGRLADNHFYTWAMKQA